MLGLPRLCKRNGYWASSLLVEEEERSREGFIFAGSGREIGFVTSAGERALEEEERFDAGGGE